MKIRIRGFAIILVLSCLLTFIFSACTASQQNINTNQTNTNQNNQETLKLLYWQAPTILNPHLSSGYKDSEASRITLEPLASYDEDNKMRLFLAAEAPTIENGGLAKDGKSVTWKLKKDIKWSDGEPFTAADVVFSYQFITNPQVGTTNAGTYQTIASVEAVDNYTVKVNFSQPTPGWFLPFVGTEGMILPKHLFETYNGANARQAPANLMAVGTGPYKVVEFKPGDTVIYEPNPYFRDADKLSFKQIQIKGGGDSTSATRAVLQTGEADYAYNVQVETKILKELETGGKGKILSSFGALSERILFNFTDPNKTTPDGERSNVKFPHPFFQDIKVRQAFALAVDRDTIVKQFYGDTGKSTANFLVAPPEYNSPNTSYEFNLEKAAALLDETGWKDSNNNGNRDQNGVEMNLVFQTSVNPLRQKTQEVIKQALASIQVGVELKSIDPSIFFSSDPSNDDTIEHFYADLAMFTTGNNSPDPTAYMDTYTCDTIPQKANNWAGENYSRFCDRKYDQLLEKSSSELNPEKRQQLFIEMNDLLVNNYILIPLVHRADVVAISNSLTGLNLTPWDRTTWNIADWKPS